MPAISLSRLRTQTAHLAEKFNDPEGFLSDLRSLLEFYQDRTRRQTQMVVRTSLPAYNTPGPVLRQILIALTPPAGERPLEAIAVVDALWQAAFLETRLLAAALVGCVPPESAMPLYGRLENWLEESREREIQQAILHDSLARLRREQPGVLLRLVEEWLKATSSRRQVWGMQALTPLLSEPGFEDLPRVFRILRPALQAAGPATQMALAECLRAMGQNSPVETGHFLHEVLMDNPRPMMVRTLQRILPALPPVLQERLRAELRIANKERQTINREKE